MSLRVCIPTAGTGSRLGQLTRFVNKSLVSIANRPALSHLIEQFPPDTEFVIALGHKGQLVREFLELAYPGRSFMFAEVERYEGPGSGLGLSLMQCRQYLQQPFVFLSCDTLVSEAIPALDRNWIGCAERAELGAYRSVHVEGGAVRAICEKGEGQQDTHQAYIGLAGIVDHALFWAAMDAGGAAAIETGEACGLRALLAQGIAAHSFTWFDTGSPEALELARQAYHEPGAPNILPKGNEAIWFVDGQVVKFSDDRAFIANRALRALEIGEFVPRLGAVKTNMYSYAKVDGEVLSDVVSLPLFERFLHHCSDFWQVAQLGNEARGEFKARCMAFYKDKTYERVALFYRTFGIADATEAINGVPMPLLGTLLAEVDWNALANGLPGRFHGDFHFENILWSAPRQAFIFLDWRQDFGGSLSVGDIYYDLAKLLHGLIVSHELIAQGHYRIDWEGAAIRHDFQRKQVLVECERHFEHWLARRGYDVGKVRLLTALIFLNIAALHHPSYSHLLYSLGKSMLYRSLNEPATRI